MDEREPTCRKFYKKLLVFYPRVFRERLGESMEQTFDDLCDDELSKGAKGSLFWLTLQLSINTGTGIIKEHLLNFAQRSAMSDIIINFRLAAIISFILVMPFMILEWVNHHSLHESFPFALFVFMWLLPLAFIVIVIPIVRNPRAGKSILANPISLLLKVAFLAIIAMVWGYSLYDQMPCFLGVPNCD